MNKKQKKLDEIEKAEISLERLMEDLEIIEEQESGISPDARYFSSKWHFMSHPEDLVSIKTGVN